MSCKMSKLLHCSIHLIEDIDEDVCALTEKTSRKIASCAKDWAELDENEKTVGLQLIAALSEQKDESFPSQYGFHRSCYKRFTDKTRIAAAQKRENKRKLNEDEEGHHKRICRSATNCSQILSNANGDITPFQEVCIICKCTKHITEVSTGIHKIEKPVKCQTFDAQKTLSDFAQRKEDTNLLLLIEGEDLIAREAVYHRSCYRNYTYMYTKTQKVPDNNYEHFCKEVIDKRILKDGFILSMNKLQQLYHETCNCEITNQALKRKLQRSHPELMYLRVTNLCWSELVLPPESTRPLTLDIDNNPFQEEDDEDESDDNLPQAACPDIHAGILEVEAKRQLFHSANILRETVKMAPKLQCPWPPTASDMTMEDILDIVPEKLFNFVACVAGLNTDLPEAGKLLEVPEEQKKKVLSICQDIIYMASKGLNPMPKHLALGLTVRHLTGSSKLISILSGLGHCLSPTSVADYDSALALLSGRDENAIPSGIKEQFTTLVFDNNDFGEETLTGKGTTHCTNGIVIQRSHANELAEEPKRERQPIPKVRGQRPEPLETYFEKISLVNRQGPASAFTKTLLEETAVDAIEKNSKIETAYIISKLPDVVTQPLPSWSGFNSILYPEVPDKSVIGYLPVIAGSPTRAEVVNEILKKCTCIADRLNQKTVVLVVDQAIYSKAQQIRWLDTSLQERVVIRLGEFHTCMAFLAVLGKRFKDGGLQDILIESNLVAEGSINGVLSGHHYNRSVRVMKVLYEAFSRLLVEAFLQSLPQEKTNEVLTKAKHLNEALENGTFFECLQTDNFQDLFVAMKEFSSIRSDESPTFQFWMTFIHMVETLLLFIRATRTGDWNLHLATVRQMLPWFFAYDRVNYARYLTVYWLEMLNLKESHSEVHEQFLAGNFVVQQQSEHGFAQTAMDQTIEQTLNRDSKTKGGITGITLKKNAVHCWILSFAERAKIQECCEDMANRKHNNRGRKELDKSRIKRDEDDLNCVVSTIKAMTNPFVTPDDELINVASGRVAPKEIRLDMERAAKLGESELDNYIDQRMQKKELDIFSPLKAQKLKTFGDTGKTKGKNEVSMLKANSQLLTRMLFIAKVKDLDMTDVLSYSLTPVPPSIGNYDGSLARTSKATLLNHLVLPENILPAPTPGAIWIIDGMAYLHQLTSIPPTFGQLARSILRGLVACAMKHQSSRIDFVPDQYWQLSIKSFERDRRGDGQGQVIRINSQEQKTPSNLKKFLSCGKNKEALVAFLYRHWQECDADLYSNVTVLLAHEGECHAFSSNGIQKVDTLSTDHEEADTRLMLHTSHALRECDQVVIHSPDTDVFLLAVALNQKLGGKVELNMGTASKPKHISISSVCERIPSSIQTALIGLHTFTGCDTTSAFKGKGKIKAYKLMLENPQYSLAFNAIGDCWTSEHLPWEDIERFLCELYGQVAASTLIEARTNIFKSCFKTDISLPPNHDEFVQHTKRANYQAAILKRALNQEMKAPSPCNHGWYLDEGQLGVSWSTKEQAPDVLLMEVFCKCKKSGCSSARCSCKSHGLKCTELCQCKECCNSETDGMRVEDVLRIEDKDDQMED